MRLRPVRRSGYVTRMFAPARPEDANNGLGRPSAWRTRRGTVLRRLFGTAQHPVAVALGGAQALVGAGNRRYVPVRHG